MCRWCDLRREIVEIVHYLKEFLKRVFFCLVLNNNSEWFVHLNNNLPFYEEKLLKYHVLNSHDLTNW